ncbi:hypothetical protein PIB30_057394 [Stylosanthes scabra]|uniref:Uncharacterized protein n=1 Tax=Stylosanthes scabra TaxID=79078 RepID=A0ABU6VKQ2_9FABA|nr:hypothetical protein [Stylosanthes scabra]
MTRNGKTSTKGSAPTAAGSTAGNLSQLLLRSCFHKRTVLSFKYGDAVLRAILKFLTGLEGVHHATNPSLTKTRYPKNSTISTLKIRTPPSRASPRLAALKDSLLLPSPTSVIRPEKLLVMALAAPMTTPPSVATVSKNPIVPILETPQPRKIRRTARMSVKPIRHRFSERIIAKGEGRLEQ